MSRTRRRHSHLAVSVVIMGLVMSTACAPPAESQSQTAASVGSSQGLDFDLTPVNHTGTTLADVKEQVVILDFWATWCPPCVAEVPHFVALQKQYGDQGLTVVGVSLDREPVEVVSQFIEKHNVNYPIFMANEEIQAAYGPIQAIPTTFVLDRQGKIVKKYRGYKSKEVFEQDIQPLL